MNKISYFVFKSGEKGLYSDDWGVKFCSPLVDLEKTDEEYRRIVESFDLSPALIRPSNNKVGIVFLPWSNKKQLLGFIVPGKDLVGRNNIALVAAFIDEQLLNESGTSQNLVAMIWNSNDVIGIAKNRDQRLRFLEGKKVLEKSILSMSENIVSPSNFPVLDENHAYLCVDNNWEKKRKRLPAGTQSDSVRGLESKFRKKKVFLWGTLIVLFLMGLSSLIFFQGADLEISQKFASPPKQKLESSTPQGSPEGGGTVPIRTEEPSSNELSQSTDMQKQQRELSERVFKEIKNRYSSFDGLRYLMLGQVNSDATQIGNLKISVLSDDHWQLLNKKEICLQTPLHNAEILLPMAVPDNLYRFFEGFVGQFEIQSVPLKPDMIRGFFVSIQEMDSFRTGLSELIQEMMRSGISLNKVAFLDEQIQHELNLLFSQGINDANAVVLFFSKSENSNLYGYVIDINDLNVHSKERIFFSAELQRCDKARFANCMNLSVSNGSVPGISKEQNVDNAVNISFKARKKVENINLRDLLKYFWEDVIEATRF